MCVRVCVYERERDIECNRERERERERERHGKARAGCRAHHSATEGGGCPESVDEVQEEEPFLDHAHRKAKHQHLIAISWFDHALSLSLSLALYRSSALIMVRRECR